MQKSNAKLAALAQQAGLGAFRGYFPYAAKNRNRLLWKLVGATLSTCGIFLLIAFTIWDDDFLLWLPVALLASAGWWLYAAYALYRGVMCRVQVHERGLVHSDHKQTQVVQWIDVLSVRMDVTEYVGAENYYEGKFDIWIRTDGHGTAFHTQSRQLAIPAEFEHVGELMRELNRVEEIGQDMRRRLDPERGVTQISVDDQSIYSYQEDLEISPMSWQDEWGPLAQLQTPEQRLTHHFYAQALFSAFNEAAMGGQALAALHAMGYQGAGSFFRGYVTLLKYYGVARSDPDELETRTWGELAMRCEEAAIARLNQDIAAGHQRLPAYVQPGEAHAMRRQMVRETAHPQRASAAPIAA